jgi:hypothetical protein
VLSISLGLREFSDLAYWSVYHQPVTEFATRLTTDQRLRSLVADALGIDTDTLIAQAPDAVERSIRSQHGAPINVASILRQAGI